MLDGFGLLVFRVEPSHVLRAIGLSIESTHGSLSLGLGRNTEEQ